MNSVGNKEQPTLYLMLGYPGAGKTTAAKIIAGQTGAEHIWADHERRKLHDDDDYGKVEKTAKFNLHLYDKLNKKAVKLLKENKSVVYDAAFNHLKDRLMLRDLAHQLNIPTVIVWVKAPKEIAKQRAQNPSDLQGTRVLGASMSDERFEELALKLEQPRGDEKVIELDGQKLSEEYIKHKLV